MKPASTTRSSWPPTRIAGPSRGNLGATSGCWASGSRSSTSAWTVASGNYSSRFSGVGAGAVHLAAEKVAAKLQAIKDHLGDDSLTLRRLAGIAHWNPDALPPGMEAGLHETAIFSAPNLA